MEYKPKKKRRKMTGRPRKNKNIFPMLVRLLKEKRDLSNLTKYRIQQLTGIRRDALAAIEEGKEVSVETVLKYVFSGIVKE